MVFQVHFDVSGSKQRFDAKIFTAAEFSALVALSSDHVTT